MVSLQAFALSMSRPACRECGHAIVKKPGPGRYPAYCGPECRQAAKPSAKSPSQSARRAAAARWAGHVKTAPTGCRIGDHTQCELDERHGTCSECGQTIRIGRSSAPPERRRCRGCQRANPRRSPPKPLAPRICELCECTYVPKYRPRPGRQQRWCSKSCTTAWANGARPPYTRVAEGDYGSRKIARNRLRLRVHAETWDGITNAQILERDRWRCGICGKRIGKTFRWPHPRSASVDHIIPLSQGGDDTAANKRAAHLACNCGRMNRGGGEQLAMIG